MGRPRRNDSIRALINKVFLEYPLLVHDQEKARNLINYLVLKNAFPADLISHCGDIFYSVDKEEESISLIAMVLLLRYLGLSPKEISCFIKGKDRVYFFTLIDKKLLQIKKCQLVNNCLIENYEVIRSIFMSFDLAKVGEVLTLVKEHSLLQGEL